MIALKISRVGNSAALILTKEALALLKAGQGDTVYLTEAPDGLRLTTYDADFERDMTLARRVMRKRRNVLREFGEMTEWRWIGEATILAVHDEQLAEHGGSGGLRDRGLLKSALARPINRAAYGEADVCVLAAAYASGIARNHPFNKRTAYVAMELFLLKNGYALEASDADAVLTMVQLAEGSLTEEAYAVWLRAASVRAEE